VRFLWRLLIRLLTSLTSAISLAAEPFSRSLLILGQSGPKPRLTGVALALLLACGPLILGRGDTARAEEKTQRVLMLYPYNNLFPVSVITGEAARKRLTERSRGSIELYTDFLDLGRFSGEAYETLTARYLVDKYRDRKPDVVMALGPQALHFLIKNRVDFGFDVPMVFCCTSSARLATLTPPGNVTGVISEFDLAKTLALAQRLQPDASHIVVVAGATEFDREWVQIARRQLAPYEQKYDTRYLVGLPYDDLMKGLKRLPRDTIVILLTMFADSTGRLFISPEIVQEVTNAATAPVYAPYETYVGRGIVGGHVDSLERIGEEIADLALDILAGASPSSLVPRVTSGNADRVDWRALKRWNLSESKLPTGSEIRFRELSLWEHYHWQLIATLAIVLFQAALIAWLLLERHRRRGAEFELRRRLLEVIHLNRTATAGVLSASFAHELNQPLGAILSNAEAAEVLLTAIPLDLGQLKEILADIRRDDQRAGEIIKHLGGLLKKRSETDLQEFDLNDAVQGALHLLDPEAMTRGVVLGVSQVQAALPVRADEVHLQQVILNLAMNGMDAMLSCVPGSRKMTLGTALAGEGKVEVSVSDSGTGIPNDKLNDIFDTFFTTKPQGTGLGLSIARTIIETYGGKIWAENRLGGGAVFRFTLPLAKTQAA
jgi:signal transduction histidine kinase